MKKISKEDIINFVCARYESNDTFVPYIVLKSALTKAADAEFLADSINAIAEKNVKEFKIIVVDEKKKVDAPSIIEKTGVNPANPTDIILSMYVPEWIMGDPKVSASIAKALFVSIMQLIYSVPAYVDASIFPLKMKTYYNYGNITDFRSIYEVKYKLPVSNEVI